MKEILVIGGTGAQGLPVVKCEYEQLLPIQVSITISDIFSQLFQQASDLPSGS